MKIDSESILKGYNIYIDDELWSTPEKIVFSVDTDKNKIEWITNKCHFPYWPIITICTHIGTLRLEKKNEQR